MKTYEHNIDESRKHHDDIRKKATLIDKTFGLRWFAEINLLQLEQVGQIGLPSCYEEAEEFLYDFWPDLPWNGPDQKAVVRLMLADPRFPAIVAAVKESVGLDMQEELQKGLEYNDDEE